MLPIDEIRNKALRKYWEVLSSIAHGASLFPIKMPFGRLRTISNYRQDKSLIEDLKAALDESRNSGLTAEWRQIRTRRYGVQSLPWRLYFSTEASYLEFIRKTQEVAHFRRNLLLIRNAFPSLDQWTRDHSRDIAEKHPHWDSLITVCQYFQKNPQPDCFVRELPVAVNTKFVESNSAILRSLLDAILPSHHRSDSERFEPRFGLKYDEPCIRLRFLDHKTQLRAGFPVADVTVPVSAFARLTIDSQTAVLVTENKMNFLALPGIDNGLAIHGAGQAVVLLQNATWLRHCHIIYWGDLDAFGFQILAQLRQLFPHVLSVMMDVTTLEKFSTYIVPAKPCPATIRNSLTPEEQVAYRRVIDRQQMLEQEHIDWEYARQSINKCLSMWVQNNATAASQK